MNWPFKFNRKTNNDLAQVRKLREVPRPNVMSVLNSQGSGENLAIKWDVEAMTCKTPYVLLDHQTWKQGFKADFSVPDSSIPLCLHAHP
jgi:hypothetical protein